MADQQTIEVVGTFLLQNSPQLGSQWMAGPQMRTDNKSSLWKREDWRWNLCHLVPLGSAANNGVGACLGIGDRKPCLENPIAAFHPAPVTTGRTRNVESPTDFRQGNIRNVKLLGEPPHGCCPNPMVEIIALNLQALLCVIH